MLILFTRFNIADRGGDARGGTSVAGGRSPEVLDMPLGAIVPSFAKGGGMRGPWANPFAGPEAFSLFEFGGEKRGDDVEIGEGGGRREVDGLSDNGGKRQNKLRKKHQIAMLVT